MRDSSPHWLRVASLVAVIGPWTSSLYASEAARDFVRPDAVPDAPEGARTQSASTEAAVDEPSDSIQFSFKNATFDAVLDFFGRSFDKPVIREAGVPGGRLDYLAPEAYTREDALRILNIILRSRGVVLQETEEFLYLRKLDAIARSGIPTFVGTLPGDVPDGAIVTVVRPLNIAVAETMAEKLAGLVAEYGSITPMPAQNALLITETAEQVRRLTGVLDELDREDPEGAIELISVTHVRARDLMEPLQALLSQKVVKFMVNQKGKQVRVEENELPGLTMAPDDRSNSIVAKGVQSRIDKLREVVQLLDTPESQAGRSMRTFSLARLSPQQAQQALDKLFATRKREEKPTIIASSLEPRITVAGTGADVSEAERVLAELDGLGGESASMAAGEGRTMSVVPVERASADAMLTAVRGLLSPRQTQTLKLLPGPDGRSIVVSGPDSDVASVLELVPVLDQRAGRDRTVRILRGVEAPETAAIERARELYDRTAGADGDPVDVERDADSGTVTLIGAPRAVDRFASLLRDVASGFGADLETRTFSLQHAVPSRVADTVRSVSSRMLANAAAADGVPAPPAPQVLAVDALDVIQVTARPEDLGLVAGLIDGLDRPAPGDVGLRVLPVSGVADVDGLVERASDLWTRLAPGRGLDAGDLPGIEPDASSRTLVVTGRTAAVDLFASSLDQARRLVAPAVEGRFLDLQQRSAAEIVAPLRELFAMAGEDGAGGSILPEPAISVVERTNQLFVRAEPAQLATIQQLVRRLDTLEPTELPPMQLLQVRAADVAGVADLLRRRYERRAPEIRRNDPVTIEADAATNTLVVTATPETFVDVKAFVDALNATADGGAERETMIFPLRRARAVDLATALDRLYPEPPMPRDRRGRPMPQLQQPREVSVTADSGTNTLIVEAPSERRASFEALVERLDRVELPPRAELRTYRIERGDPVQLARTLTELARRGVLSEPAEDGGKPVDVLIQAEPRSGTLIVAGDETTFLETEALLSDLSAVPVRRSLRVFTLPGADLDDVAMRAQRLYTEQTAETPGAGEVAVEIDTTAGALLVVADDESMRLFAGILDQLRRTIGPPPDVRLIALEHAAAAEVVSFLGELADGRRAMAGESGPPPTFEAIERTNSVLVAATREQHAIIREVVRSLDRPETAELPPLRILRVRAAEAGNLANALNRQYDARPPEERRDKPVRITADGPTNALVVAAHPELLPEIEAIVEELNAAGTYDATGREIRIFPLTTARAEDLARTLDEMFPAPPPPRDRRGRIIPGLQEPPEVVVRADAQTNSIIVDAPAARMDGFERLVQQLDRARPTEATDIRTYTLVHAEADAVARTLERLGREGALVDGGRDRRVPVSVDIDERGRRLTVSGPIDAFERVEQVLAQLDVDAGGPETTLRFFPLEHARAESIAQMLRQVLTTRVRETVAGGADAPERLIDVSTDRATNTLILSLPEAMLPVAEELIERLDQPAAAIGSRTIRVRPLVFADAAEIGRTLGGAVGSMTSPTTGEPLDARIVPAGGSNAILLVGIPADLDVVEELIEPLDSRPSRDAVDARTFRVQHAEATDIASTLRTLLEDRRTDPRVLAERIRRSRGTYEPPAPIRVEADGRTNTLVVSGPSRTVALAEQLLTTLDMPPREGDVETRLYTPTRARAGVLASSVRRLADRAGLSRRRVTIDEDPGTGSLIVSGDADAVEEVSRMLAERDAIAPVTPSMDLIVLSLRQAEPRAVASTVQGLLRDRGRWPRPLIAALDAGLPVAEPTVTADAAGGRVLVSAPAELAETARTLVEQLDRAPAGGAMDVRVFSLREAEAPQVAEALRAALSAEAARDPGLPEPSVVAESSSNSVVVTAASSQLDRVEAIVASMDETGGPPDRVRVRTVSLTHARAEAVAPIVERLLGKQQEDPNQRFNRRFFFNDFEADDPDLRVSADARLNAVVISATPGVLAAAEEMVRQLDVPAGPGAGGGRSVRVLTLRAADAQAVAETLDAVFDDGATASGETPPVIRVDAESNSLVIRAAAEQYAVIERTVSALDSASVASARQLRVFPVDPARAQAEDVAAALERLLGGEDGGSLVEVVPLESLLEGGAEGSGAPAGASSHLIDGVDGMWGGALTTRVFQQFVAAALTAPAQPVSSIDSGHDVVGADAVLGEDSLVGRAVRESAAKAASANAAQKKESARATAAAPAAESVAAPESAAAEAEAEVESESASLDELIARAVAIYEQEQDVDSDETNDDPDPVDGPDGGGAPDPAPSDEADSAAAAVAASTAIESPVAPADSDRVAPGAAAETPPVTVAVDPERNALVVLGPAAAVDRIQRLAGELADQLPAAARPVRAIPLPTGVDAERVRSLTVEVLRRLAPSGGRPGDVLRRVGVVADSAANTVYVVASDADFRTVGRLVAGFATGGPTEGTTLRVYSLESTTAGRAESAFRALLAGEDAGRGRGRGRQAARVSDGSITIPGPNGGEITGELDPGRVRIQADDATNSLLVTAPDESLPVLDAFVELIDQKPVDDTPSLRLFTLRNARAADVRNSLRNVLRVRFDAVRGTPGASRIRPEVAIDARTNTLIVTAAPEQLVEVERLLEDLDRDLGDATIPLDIVTLTSANPRDVARAIEDVVVGNDAERRASVQVTADDPSGTLLLRVSPELRAEVDRIIAALDSAPGEDIPVRTITLERADAMRVADSLQRLFDDRARLSGGRAGRRQAARRVSIVGNPASGTLLVSADDEDFAQVEELAAQFDAEGASAAWDYRLIRLDHAGAQETAQLVLTMVQQLEQTEGSSWWMSPRDRQGPRRGSLSVSPDRRLNALIVSGSGDKFDLVEGLVSMVDVPKGEGGRTKVARAYPIDGGDPRIAATLVEQVFGEGDRPWWADPDPDAVQVEADRRSGTLFVVATAEEQDAIKSFLEGLDTRVAGGEVRTEVVAVEYASAGDLARTLGRFVRDRARAAGNREAETVIQASESAGALVLAGPSDDLDAMKQLIAQLDRPDAGRDRVTEIIALRDGEADAIADIVREQFETRGENARITVDRQSNSLVVSAPAAQYERIAALIDRLDRPQAGDETLIRTYTLASADAAEVQTVLTAALDLDFRGETDGTLVKLSEEDDAVEVVARVVADLRSNSLLITATPESFPVIERLISELDEAPAAAPVDYRIIELEHAFADDIKFTLMEISDWPGSGNSPTFVDDRVENRLIVTATVEQFELIERIVEDLDQPSGASKRTEFVPLQVAEADKVREALRVFYGAFALEADTPGKRNVSITADMATNSLIISAEEAEWEGIRALLAQLDSPEYDASLQLRVIALTHADARSVAAAINEAFGGRSARSNSRGGRNNNRGNGGEGEGDGENGDGRRGNREAPAQVVGPEEWVRASAEPLTNSLIVSAARQNLTRIEAIVAELDRPDTERLPAPRLIPTPGGDPERIADALNAMYADDEAARATLRIVGDPASGTVIVRADDAAFEQIADVADSLLAASGDADVEVAVIRPRSAAVRRIADAIRSAYEAKAARRGADLSIDVDPASGAIVVGAPTELMGQIRATIDELDALAPAAGQGVMIIDLEHVDAAAVEETIRQIGLDRPAGDDGGRVVSEPVRVAPMAGRNAVLIVANPVDQDTVLALVKSIDVETSVTDADTQVLRLRQARASAVAGVLEEILDPAAQQSGSPLAQAAREQVRRLRVRGEGLEDADLSLDLGTPIRIVPDDGSNTLLVTGEPANVMAVLELARTLDTVPLLDGLTIQIFPLQNIEAADFVRIAEELFSEGRRLGNVPGSDLQGVPGGTVGQALLDDVALSVDPRTNTVVAAGSEDSVALVDVLSKRLDADVATGWVEPRIVPLIHADAEELADLLEEILVEGAGGATAGPLRNQVARLRMLRGGGVIDPNRDPDMGIVVESDVFQPMQRLVIRPDIRMNAIVLVGTPDNLDIVGELVSLFDIPAASEDASVRVYPVTHASAARLATTLENLVQQQVRARSLRPGDELVIVADDRTNALVISTSRRSFALVEQLLETLDSPMDPSMQDIRRIDLEIASAARVADLVQRLMDARVDRLRRVQPETAELERATVIPDSRTNSLIVAAGADAWGVIERLVEDLDASDGDESLLEVIAVEQASVERLQETIDAVMQRRYAGLPGDLRRGQIPLVVIDPRTSSLLVSGNPADVADIRTLVERLDEEPSDPAIGLHVVQVPERLGAESLADRLERLLDERQRSIGEERPSDRVAIEPDPGSNTLIVAASREQLEVVQGLVEVLADAGADAVEAESFDVITLTSSRAEDIVPLVDELYAEEARDTRGDNALSVTADERINAVLVRGGAADIEAIRTLVRRLDGERPASVVEIKTITLASASAVETVQVIQDVLEGGGGRFRRGSVQATVLRYLGAIAGGEDDPVDLAGPGASDGSIGEFEVSAAIRDQIRLTPDARTNAIIVRAPADAMTLIERLIEDLDASSTGSQNIRIFKLTNADATAMSEILAELFNLDRRRDAFVLRPTDGAAALGGTLPAPGSGAVDAAGPGGLGDAALTAVPAQRLQLSITVDSRTNSLLVSGTPTYLDLVDEVVTELDALEANERETFVVQLRNAEAISVAEVLGQFVEEEQEKLVSTLGRDELGSAARLLEREITIAGDTASNSVLVSASPRYAERVRDLIETLDVDPPQVLIQVLLAEVTLDTSDEWGLDFSADARIDDVGIAPTFGLASAFVGGVGTPSLNVVGRDFQVLLRAIQSQGRVQVLSNPSIMAANNQPANLFVGERIRIAESTGLTEGGNLNTGTTEEQVGITLNVTPSINPDGFVRLDVQPELSALTSRTTQINEDLETPIITERSAQTTVTVRDGQTIVIGGLISDRYEFRRRKVPFFGDLPVVGPLFRSDDESSLKTELLIVLTPHVIQSPTDLARTDELTSAEVSRLTLPEALRDQIRKGLFEGGGLYDAEGKPIDWDAAFEDVPSGRPSEPQPGPARPEPAGTVAEPAAPAPRERWSGWSMP